MEVGDVFYPPPKFTNAEPEKLDERAALIKETTASLKYDAFVPGELDFRNGPEALLELQKTNHIPMIAANLLTEDGKPLFGKSVIVEKNGLRIAFIGLVGESVFAGVPANADFNPKVWRRDQIIIQRKKPTHMLNKSADLAKLKQAAEDVEDAGKQADLSKLISAFQQGQDVEGDDDTADFPAPEYKGMKFKITDPVEAAKAEIQALRGKADLFIALSHMDRTDADRVRNEVPEFNFLIDGHYDGKSVFGRKETGPGANVIRVGNKGKTLGLLKISIVNGKYEFDDRSDIKKKQASLERYKKSWDELVKNNGGKDPMTTFPPEDRNYKRAERTKKQIEEMQTQIGTKKEGSYFMLERISLDKAVPNDPQIEKRQDEVQPPSERTK